MSINTEIARLEAAKTALAASITSKGVTVPDGTKLDGMSALVDSIQQGGSGDDWQITDARYLFYYGARWDVKDKLLPHLTGITNAESMLSYITSGTIDLSEFDFSKVTDATRMFGSSTALTSAEGINLQSCTIAKYLFQNCKNLKTADISTTFSMAKKVDASNLFIGCSKLESVSIAGRFSSISGLFQSCAALKSVDFSNVSLDYVTNLGYAFSGCSNLKSVDMSHLDLSKVNTANCVFDKCDALEEILSFAAPSAPSMTKPFPIGPASVPLALKRLTFKKIYGGYAVKASFSIAYNSFERAGMVEMFNSLPNITPLNLAAAYKKITITGNPCVTDGTLTDTDKAIATDKGWTLVI